MNALLPGCTVVVYGQLSEEKISGIDPIKTIFQNKRIEGWLLPYWLKTKGLWATMGVIKEAKKLISDVEINKKQFGFHQIHEAIAYYRENMSAGKVLLTPSITE